MDGKGRFEEDATGMRWLIHQWFSYLSTMRFFYRKTAVDDTLVCICVVCVHIDSFCDVNCF